MLHLDLAGILDCYGNLFEADMVQFVWYAIHPCIKSFCN